MDEFWTAPALEFRFDWPKRGVRTLNGRGVATLEQRSGSRLTKDERELLDERITVREIDDQSVLFELVAYRPRGARLRVLGPDQEFVVMYRQGFIDGNLALLLGKKRTVVDVSDDGHTIAKWRSPIFLEKVVHFLVPAAPATRLLTILLVFDQHRRERGGL